MKELLENVKVLIPLIAAIIALAGFYYSTQHRLDHLEDMIIDLQQEDIKLKKSIKRGK